MPPQAAPKEADKTAALAASLDQLRGTIEKLPNEYGYAFHPSKNLIFSYAKGIASGLGALTAVAIVIPLLVWFLQSIKWVPLIGDFVANVATRVEQVQGR